MASRNLFENEMRTISILSLEKAFYFLFFYFFFLNPVTDTNKQWGLAEVEPLLCFTFLKSLKALGGAAQGNAAPKHVGTMVCWFLLRGKLVGTPSAHPGASPPAPGVFTAAP